MEPNIPLQSLITPHLLNNTSPADQLNENSYEWILPIAYQALTYIPSVCLSKFYDYFIDGDKPWKQMKYDLSLNSIIKAFNNSNASLNVLKQTYQKNESSPLQLATLSVIKALLRENPLPNDTPRLNYRQFIDSLRDALSLDCGDIEYTPFLEKICFYRFTEFHLFHFCETLINQIVKEGIKATHQSSTLKLQDEYKKELYQIPLKDQFFYIDAAPQQNKAPLSHLYVDLIRGGCNIAFDAQRNSNIPYALFDFGLNSKNVRVLRTGSPTMQRYDYQSLTYSGDANITPEFEAFIESLSTKDMKLLYISLQDNQKRFVGSEKSRNSALLELQKRFPKTFYMVIFSHDSHFYHQSGSFEMIDDALLFKMQFMNEMTSNENGFFFPNHLIHFETFKNIMDEVHADLFFSKAHLIREERLNFIEMYYTRLTFYLLTHSKADYLINSCKDSIDRAAIRNTLFQYLLLIFFKKERSGVHLNQLYTYLHAGAFLVKKRALNNRQDRLVSILKLLESDKIREQVFLRKEAIGIEGSNLFIKYLSTQDNTAM